MPSFLRNLLFAFVALSIAGKFEVAKARADAAPVLVLQTFTLYPYDPSLFQCTDLFYNVSEISDPACITPFACPSKKVTRAEFLFVENEVHDNYVKNRLYLREELAYMSAESEQFLESLVMKANLFEATKLRDRADFAEKNADDSKNKLIEHAGGVYQSRLVTTSQVTRGWERTFSKNALGLPDGGIVIQRKKLLVDTQFSAVDLNEVAGKKIRFFYEDGRTINVQNVSHFKAILKSLVFSLAIDVRMNGYTLSANGKVTPAELDEAAVILHVHFPEPAPDATMRSIPTVRHRMLIGFEPFAKFLNESRTDAILSISLKKAVEVFGVQLPKNFYEWKPQFEESP